MTKQPSPRERSAPSPSRADFLVLCLFFLSGASALVYEVVWSRLLTFVFGGTAFAIATVLAAYMAGLAIGSWTFGRRIDKGGHPIIVYALLEGGIALWALVLPAILTALNGFYGVLYQSLNPGPSVLALIRFLICFLVLLVPTILMGGTLPVLSRLLVGGRKSLGLKTGILYGTNTIGAVAGTAAAGFFLIPNLGMQLSTWVAIAFNVAVTILAFGLRPLLPYEEPSSKPVAAPEPEPVPADHRLKKIVLFVYASSGFAALTYEVAWTKVLSGALGTTTYAFSAMLTTFLLGLALGAFIMARLADRHNPVLLLAWSQLGVAVLGLLALPVFGNLPYLFIEAYRQLGPSWQAQTLAKFALCAVTMLPPTLLMGGAFPLVARIYADAMGKLGRQVGTLYSSNTLGAILGSFSAGFILIPLVGRQGTILTAAAVNIVSASLLYWTIGRTLSGRARIVAALTALAILPALYFGSRPWDPYVMSSGAYVYAETYAREPDLRKSFHDSRLLYYEEDTEAIIAVYRAQHVLSLRTNGKVEASSSGDMLTQKLISHLPLLHHPNPADVLMIGLASGISLGSALAYPQVQQADCVEMLEGMTNVTDFFRKYNHDCMNDPRTRLIINDGRNHLALSDRTYDIIISQPSNPWIAGIGSLFTREFFAIGARRLKPDGIFCQWVQMYQMSREDFGSVVKTFHEAWPHMSIWMGSPGDIVLLGSRVPLELDYRKLSSDLSIESVTADLQQVGVRDVFGFLQSYIGGDDAAAALTRGAGRTITDDNLLLEFSMPRYLYSSDVDMMILPVLAPLRQPYTNVVEVRGLEPDSARAVTDTMERYYRGRNKAIDGIYLAIGKEHGSAVTILEEALQLAPTDPLIGHYISSSRNEVGITLLQGGQETQALKEFRRSAEVGSASERALAYNNIGLHHYSAGIADSAAWYWKMAADLEPESPIIRYNLGLVYDGLGRRDLAAAEYRDVLKIEPDNEVVLNNLAWILAQNQAGAGEAVELARRAVELNPSSGNLDTFGFALGEVGKLSEAEAVLRRALAEGDGNAETAFHLGQVLARAGKQDEARVLFRKAADSDPSGDLGARARAALAGL